MSKETGGNYSVYVLESPEGKKYVGCTSLYPWMRWNAGHGYIMNKDLHDDIQKFGWDNFKRTIVKSGMPIDEAAQMEANLIADLETQNSAKGYNKTPGGDHLTGKVERLEYKENPFSFKDLPDGFSEEDYLEMCNNLWEEISKETNN